MSWLERWFEESHMGQSALSIVIKVAEQMSLSSRSKKSSECLAVWHKCGIICSPLCLANILNTSELSLLRGVYS